MKTQTGKTVAISIEPSSTIETFKQKLQDEAGIPANLQCLSYATSLLEDGHTLMDYGVEEGSSLELYVRMSGGIEEVGALSPDDPFTSSGSTHHKLLALGLAGMRVLCRWLESAAPPRHSSPSHRLLMLRFLHTSSPSRTTLRGSLNGTMGPLP